MGILTQLEVDQQKGMSFADSLKAVLRQDPEVIMIGEIRDLETAEIAIRAGLTGHLVLSTVHSGMSAGVFNRLLDMGVEPFLVASSVSGVLAQRLVRKTCEHCQISYRPDVSILEKLDFPKTLTDYDFKRGEGCERCLMSGYRGRTAISELLMVKDSIKELILSRSPTSAIEIEARSLGMRSLREDGIQKVIQGITTIEELARIL
jgi:type II secretory ATPase GspE/PulE/Tfp pilus assembly ATPase PilB-like protein